jgi:hypothetical protein
MSPAAFDIKYYHFYKNTIIIRLKIKIKNKNLSSGKCALWQLKQR